MFNKAWLDAADARTQNPPKQWTWKYQYLCWGNKSQEAPGSINREVEGDGGRVSLGRGCLLFRPGGISGSRYSGSSHWNQLMLVSLWWWGNHLVTFQMPNGDISIILCSFLCEYFVNCAFGLLKFILHINEWTIQTKLTFSSVFLLIIKNSPSF